MRNTLPEKIKIAGVDCYVKGDLQQKNASCVMLLHGYGANGLDLFPLSSEIPADPKTVFIFPEAEKRIQMGEHYSGRAWFDIDIMQLQIAAQEGELLEHFEKTSALLEKPRKQIEAVLKNIDWPADKLSLGGFSQGAMLATDIALHLSAPIKSLILYSSTFQNPTAWPILAPAKSRMRLFQSHGMMDEVLPYELGRALFDMLKKSGLKGEFVGFRGGHEIPSQVIRSSAAYI